jgi:hypothetical protein
MSKEMSQTTNKIVWIILLGALMTSRVVYAQSPYEFSGYLSEMPSYIWYDGTQESVFDVLIHNRINLSHRINEKYKVKVAFRNRLFWGESVESTINFKHLISSDQGVIDLSFNWEARNKYVINTSIDRLLLEYEKRKMHLSIGRQRINWSQTMVWNPNDIFNSYSYFNFDYPERPGMDGIRFQYYTNEASHLEAVMKVDKDYDITLAGLYRFNTRRFDIQFIAGQLEQEDWIAGAGWNGHIGGAGFYGELSYLNEINKPSNDIFIGSVGGNYTFKNALMLSAEYLYSSNLQNYQGNYSILLNSQSSVKRLSINDHSYVVSGSFPATPLLNISMSYVGFGSPSSREFYLGPTMEYSLADNLYLTAVVQYYKLNNIDDVMASYLRFKWNF